MRRRRSRTSVSLFPFLSVLLCTLGSLIFLLLVLDYQARQARGREAEQTRTDHRQQEAARSAALAQCLAEEAADAEARHRRAQADADGLRARLAETVMLWANKRQALTRAELALDWERRRLEGLESRRQSQQEELDRLTGQQALAQALEAHLALAVENMNERRQRLELLAGQNRRPRYSLLPYKGRRGTSQPPIFVECVDDVAKFQPSGETLSRENFDPERFRQLVERHAKQLTRGTLDRRPYLLLLVRPSGIPLYYAALRAIRDADFDLGYELIEEDWELDFTTAVAEMVVGGGATSPLPADENKHGASGASMAWRPEAAFELAHSWPPVSPIAAAGHDPGRPHRPCAGDRPALDENLHPDPAKTFDKLSLAQPKPIGSCAAGRDDIKNGNMPAPVQPTEGGRPSGGSGNPGTVRPVPIGDPSREWEIVLECRGSQVVIPTLRRSFDLDAIAKKESPLAALIRSSIEARRRGIPDLQPRLKFIIHADGLKTYYHAAEALEGLKLPARWIVLDNNQRPVERPQD